MANKELLASLQSEISAIENGKSSSKRSKQNARRTPNQICSANNKQRTEAEESNEAFSAEADESNEAFKKVVALVNVQERSTVQLRDKLSKSGFTETAINDALDRAHRCGIVDDLRFADLLIRSRISQGKGTTGIEVELKKNGINPDEVDGWPYEYATSYEDDFDRALTLLRKKPPRAKNKREAAYRKLVQRGFSTSIASDAAKKWCDEQESEN